MDKLLTGKELAEILNVSTQTIYYWVSRNEIPYVKIGKHNRFIKDDVIKYFVAKSKALNSSKELWKMV